MRYPFLLVGLCLLGAGCGPIVRYSTRNLVQAQCDFWGEVAVNLRNCRLAEVAWEEVRGQHPYSEFYADGFKKGFVDYLQAGGCGEPPVVPPWKLRKPRYETPEGVRAVEDWFAGFRHGAQVAQASGYRELVIAPVAGPPPAYLPRDPRPQADDMPLLPPPRRQPPDADGWLPPIRQGPVQIRDAQPG